MGPENYSQFYAGMYDVTLKIDRQIVSAEESKGETVRLISGPQGDSHYDYAVGSQNQIGTLKTLHYQADGM